MHNADYIQRFVRNRTVRLGLAFSLIALSMWAFLPYVSYRISSSAFVNAELERVTAPIAGRFTNDLPRRGNFIERSTEITLIKALSPDEGRLLRLSGQIAEAKERTALARSQLAEIAAADADLAKRAQIYREGMIERLGHERDETEAEKIGCQAEAGQRREVRLQMEELVKAGTASQMRSAEALALQQATSTHCQMAGARLDRLQAELASAQGGVFLEDGANDAPYSQQQRDRLFVRRQELESKVLDERLQFSQLATEELAQERDRLDHLSHFDLTLPAGQVVWSVAASPGSSVSEGQTLFDLADCENRFVIVELPDRDFEQIKAEAPALVRLIGSDDWKQGSVRQVRGSAARADDRLLAAQVPRPDPNSITVEIGLPPGGAQTDRNNFCNIGRVAEVRFQRAGFGLPRGWGKKLQGLVSYFRLEGAVDRTARN
jgi:hypothetical protein